MKQYHRLLFTPGLKEYINQWAEDHDCRMTAKVIQLQDVDDMFKPGAKWYEVETKVPEVEFPKYMECVKEYIKQIKEKRNERLS